MQTTPASAPPSPDAAPAPPAPPPRALDLPVPRTVEDVVGLRAVQAELTRQLQAAGTERAGIVAAVQETGRVTRPGLEQRLAVVDARVLRLEADVALVGDRLSRADPLVLARAPAPREAVASVPPPRGRPFAGFDRGPSASVVAIVFIVSVFLPLAIALARILVRRTRTAAPDPALREASARLARLEQAVDAIAVEVERVSEGQRFVTRVLTDGRGAPALAQSVDTADALSPARPNG